MTLQTRSTAALITTFILIVFLPGCIEGTAAPTTPTAVPTTPTIPTAAAPAPTPLTARDDQLTIGVILFINDDFFKMASLGMEETAAKNGVNIQFRFHNDSTEQETEWIEEFTRQGVDAIIISPRVANLNGSLPALLAAHEAGVKIICYSGCITGEARNQIISGIFETDQYMLGYNTGNYLASWLEDRSLTEVHLGVLSCCPERSDGFRQALADNNAAWQEAGTIKAYYVTTAVSAAEILLQNNPAINIIWAENEGATIGAVTAVRQLNLARPVYVFGVDISPETAQMLLADDNILQAVSAQSPRLMGQMALEAAVAAIRQNTNAGYVVVPGTFYTRENRESIETYLQKQ